MNSKSDFYMAKNGRDTNHTRHISIIVNVLRNGKKLKTHKIEWCEVVLKLADIETKNIGENNLNPRTKYIMGRLDK